MKNTALVSLISLLISINILVAQDTAYDLYRSTEVVPIKEDIKETWLIPPTCTDNTHTAHVIAYAYALMSVINAGPFVDTDPDLYSYSAYSIHNRLRKNCTEDITIHEGLDIMKLHGIAPVADFPATNCTHKSNRTAVKAATKNRIKDHFPVLNKSMKPEDKVLAVQKQLHLNKNPVIVQLNVNQNIKDVPSGLYPVCIVGYDSNKGGFELVSSNSKTQTDNGYLRISYEDFGQMATEGYVMVLDDGTLPSVVDEPIVKNISPEENIQPEQRVEKSMVKLHGKFEFRFVERYDERTGKPVFASANPTLRNNTYTLANWKTDDVYQLLGTTMKAYSYTYVFSVDAEGKTEVHFPPLDIALDPDTNPNEPYYNLMTANKVPLKKTMVPDETAYMVIPDEASALQSVHPGTDYICVIYSHHQLHDITERIVRVHEASQQDFQQRLNEGFRDILMPNEDIRYTDDLMSFEAASDKGTAVPVVLKIQAN